MSEQEPTEEQYAQMRPLFEHPPNLPAIREALGIFITKAGTIYTHEPNVNQYTEEQREELNQMGEQ